MFAYCNNNPINAVDSSGRKFTDPNRRDNGSVVGYTDTGTGFIQSVIYDVPTYRQGSYRLCWAFCEIMYSSYSNNTKLTNEIATTLAIITAIIYHKSTDESVWNNGGWPSNRGDAVEDIESIYDLYEILEANGPVYASYDANGASDPHLVLVVGVNCNTDTVYTNNPWVNTRSEQSFSDFLSGPARHRFTVPGYAFGRIYLIKRTKWDDTKEDQ